MFQAFISSIRRVNPCKRVKCLIERLYYTSGYRLTVICMRDVALHFFYEQVCGVFMYGITEAWPLQLFAHISPITNVLILPRPV